MTTRVEITRASNGFILTYRLPNVISDQLMVFTSFLEMIVHAGKLLGETVSVAPPETVTTPTVVPELEEDADAARWAPAPYDHKAACQEIDADKTVTQRDPQNAQGWVTLLSVDDTRKILRGEPASNFEERFVMAAIGSFFGAGRTIVGWDEVGDQLRVRHLD